MHKRIDKGNIDISVFYCLNLLSQVFKGKHLGPPFNLRPCKKKQNKHILNNVFRHIKINLWCKKYCYGKVVMCVVYQIGNETMTVVAWVNKTLTFKSPVHTKQCVTRMFTSMVDVNKDQHYICGMQQAVVY